MDLRDKEWGATKEILVYILTPATVLAPLAKAARLRRRTYLRRTSPTEGISVPRGCSAGPARTRREGVLPTGELARTT